MKPATSLCCLRRSVATKRCTNTNPTTASTVATATNKRPVRTRIGNLLPEHACSLDRSFRRRRNIMPNANARLTFGEDPFSEGECKTLKFTDGGACSSTKCGRRR
jgi:hypothetical protein